MPAIRGDKVNVRILENGEVVGLYSVVQWSARQDANVEERHYPGQTEPESRKLPMGWSGRMVLDVKNANLDFLIQRIDDASDAGVQVPQVTIAIVEEYNDVDNASSTTHVFSGCQLVYEDHTGGGKPDLIQKSFSFKAQRKRVENV